MNILLKYYGFDTEIKQNALIDLMKRASGNSISSKKVLDSILQPDGDIIAQIVELIQFSQHYFVIRKGNQERYEVAPTKWMHEKQNEVIKLLSRLEIFDAVMPKSDSVEAICILGALRYSINIRFKFAEEVIIQNPHLTQKLFLLSGERYVTFREDGTSPDGKKDDLQKIADSFSIPLDKLTEAHIMQYDLKNYKNLSKLATTLINTLATFDCDGSIVRPTTATTVDNLFKNHPELKEKKLLFVSNAPYIKYQKGVISEILRSINVNADFQVIGSSMNQDVHDETQKTSLIKSAAEGLGSAIYSNTLGVIHKMIKENVKLNLSSASIEKLKNEYKNNELLFKNIDPLFSHLSPDTELHTTVFPSISCEAR